MSNQPPQSTQPSVPAQPIRGAARNQQALSDNAPFPDGDGLLPELNPGVTLLDIEGSRGVPIVQSLVLDHLLLSDGPAFWVDAQGFATTTSLARLTPSQRLLARVHVARGFTVYQHYGAVSHLPTAVHQHIQQQSTTGGVAARYREATNGGNASITPSLIVAPALDYFYRADDTLGIDEAQMLQARTLARLHSFADGYGCPVLVTRTTTDGFSEPIETAADKTIRCEQTRMGPRFVGDEFETLLFPVDGGEYFQTTLSYWRQLLGARAEQVNLQPTMTPTPTPPGPGNDIGDGVMADGSRTSLTANPLLDAWNNTGGRGGR